MTIQSKNNDDGNSFEYRLKEVSDDEIIHILKFREHYQPQAVKDAIKEALHRGIITSIDDLDKDEFKPQPLPAKSIFPIGYTDAQNIALFKGLCRRFYIIGIIPLIYTFFLFLEHLIFQAISSLIIGLSLIFLIYKTEKTKLVLLTQLIVGLNIPLIIYTIYYFASHIGLKKMDYAAIIIIILIILYISLYLYKITSHLNKSAGK